MILIIDTSSEDSLLALVQDGKVIASTIRKHANQLSSTLLPDIQALVQKTGLNFQQLTTIAAGVGPGSYTGTRVGVAVAKTLSFGLNIPLKSFCSLLAFLPNMTGSFACIIESRTKEIFVLKGESSEHQIKLTTSRLMDLASAAEALRDVETIVGDPCAGIFSQCKKHPPGFDSILKWLIHHPLSTLDPKHPQADVLYLHTP